MPDFSTPAARHQRWHQRRLADLDCPQGWPGLIGLVWLEPGLNRVGSAPDCPVRLPDGQAYAGAIRWQEETISWEPEGGVSQPLTSDQAGEPTRVEIGSTQFFVLERDGRLAVRLKDLKWQEKSPFPGVECFPYDPAWCLEGAWETLETPVVMEVPTVTGELKTVAVQHRAVFSLAGESFSLLPMEVDADGAFFVFRDGGSGRLSYGAGRFLRTRPPREGRVVLDFNRAYNPPCAFTPFATCPLPPPENWLPVVVLAGEKKFLGGH